MNTNKISTRIHSKITQKAKALVIFVALQLILILNPGKLIW